MADREGSFEWTLERLTVADNPIFTAVGLVVCRNWAVWPEQLLGRELAGDAVSSIGSPPLLTGYAEKPSSLGYVVLARRFGWHLAHQLTEEHAEVIAPAFGGHKPETVRPWLPDLAMFTEAYPGMPVARLAVELSEAAQAELAATLT